MNHRSTMLSANGTLVAPETFAVDYIRLVDGRQYAADGTQNADWYGYGATIHAVAGGRVVWAADDRPDVPPFLSVDDNPTVTKPSEFGGNGVVVKTRPGVFAHYYHLQPGSVWVEDGQRVRTGQKLGLFGNSGNSNGAHLHFGITDGRHPLTSTSLPFEIDHFRLEGTASFAALGELMVTGKPHNERCWPSRPQCSCSAGESRPALWSAVAMATFRRATRTVAHPWTMVSPGRNP